MERVSILYIQSACYEIIQYFAGVLFLLIFVAEVMLCHVSLPCVSFMCHLHVSLSFVIFMYHLPVSLSCVTVMCHLPVSLSCVIFLCHCHVSLDGGDWPYLCCEMV